jgi:hypothetical protein
MTIAYDTLLERSVHETNNISLPKGRDDVSHPYVLTLGGDHTIVRPSTLFST